MISNDRVIARLESARRGLDLYKRKLHRLRRLVAGDISAIRFDATSSIDDATSEQRPFRLNLEDILVTDFEEARHNGMLKAIKTLVLQTAYYFPEIEFKGIEPEEAAINAGYCRKRMGPKPFGCNAKHHGRLALLDYATGGLGWGYTPMQKGMPAFLYADTLDVKWDQTARIPQDITWWSISVPRSMGYWVSIFGMARLQRFIKSDLAGTSAMDQPFELEFYYDTEDTSGNYKVFAKTGDDKYDDQPVFSGSNPCYFETPAGREPFLPCESMFFMALPSVRHPIGIAEQMLPSQLAVWRADRAIRDIIDRGAGFYECAENAINSEERKKFEKNETGGILYTKDGNSIHERRSLEVPPYLVNFRTMSAQEMIEQSGADPFAMGDRVQGIEYAAQVNALQNGAGLTAGTIAKDNSDWWERMTTKFLAKGKAYDSKPIIIPIDGEDLVFDQADPISEYLRPDAEITVREESMKFRSRGERIQEAALQVDTALKVQPFFPKAILKAYGRFLEATGEQSPDQWMEGSPLLAPPPQPGQVAAQQLISGGAPMPGAGVIPADQTPAMMAGQTT